MKARHKGISHRIKRKQVRRMMLPSARVENRYAAGLRSVLGWLHDSYMEFFEPRLASVAKSDSLHVTDLKLLFGTLSIGLRHRVINLFNEMSGEIDIDNAKILSDLLHIDMRRIGVSSVIDRFREQSIRLVEDAGRKYAEQVREVFETPGIHNLRVEEIRKKLLDRGDVSKSHADLIARDQVLKMNGEITATRQQRAGVTQYEWSTSMDQRVREDHAALEGTIQDWNVPPVVDEKSGRTEHPGQDFQCRCIAIPVMPTDTE